jgi:tripartite-type tricarboxylate transporter receptor subunit TctC
MATTRHVIALCAGLLAAVGLAAPAGADAAADFYKGKTVSFVVGAGTGGGYDAYMRLLAQHIAKHMPGAPTAVVVNMPGGGGVKATNYV